MTPDAILLGLLSAGGTVLLFVLRMLDKSKNDEKERRFQEAKEKQTEVEADAKVFATETRHKQDGLSERLRLAELAQVEMKGRLALTEQVQSQATNATAEIRDQMVHRREFESFAKSIEQQLHEMMRLVREGMADRRGQGRQTPSSESDPRMPAVRGDGR